MVVTAMSSITNLRVCLTPNKIEHRSVWFFYRLYIKLIAVAIRTTDVVHPFKISNLNICYAVVNIQAVNLLSFFLIIDLIVSGIL